MKRAAWVLVCCWIGALSLVAYVGIRLAGQPGSPRVKVLTVKPQLDLARGQALYQQHCARCHGAEGRGDGLDAKRMLDPPRNFTTGTFEYRSTASGTPPTDEDLFQIITDGIPAAGMPGFGGLSEETRWQLAHVIKQFSPIFEETAPELVQLGPDPGPQRTNLTRGKNLYIQLGCAACHGGAGRANGPSAASLVDNWGNPIKAADLTKGWGYHGGSDPRAIALRLMTGIDGTPMPSYAEAVSLGEAWHLASYVHSLQEEPHWNSVITSTALAGELPTSLADSTWDTVPPTDLRLSSVIYQGGKVVPTTGNAIRVQAVHNHEAIVFRLLWHDPTESRGQVPDALVMAFTQEDHPNASLGNFEIWPFKEAPALDLCSWRADHGQAKELVAHELPGNDDQGRSLFSVAMYEDGRWFLLVKRPLVPSLEGTIPLSPERSSPVVFATWDGDRGEQGRLRAVSSWVQVRLGD